MHNCTFFIIDDDKSIIRMLSNIIEDYDLGQVSGAAYDGKSALDSILTLRPDIVLIDYLLPEIDGASLVSQVKKANMSSKFVMISQVNSPEMISQAYKSGIEFFINKPINVIEVTSVIKRVCETISLQKTIRLISTALHDTPDNTTQIAEVKPKKQIQAIFTDLGIWGETGAEDLFALILTILEMSPGEQNSFSLSELYHSLQREYESSGLEITAQGIEQRIRRIIQKVMHNLAIMGLEDFGNDRFVLYSSMLFNFKEIKKEMDQLQGKTTSSGRIHIRKFLNGIVSHLKDM